MARNYRAEYDEYQGTPEQKHKRALRNAARREALAAGIVHKGDNKEIDHKHMLKNMGSHPSAAEANKPANTRVLTEKQNRGWRKGHHGY